MNPQERVAAMLKKLNETEQTVDTKRLVITDGPSPVTGAAGTVIGFEVWVRLYDGDKEVRIDPHRVFVNPPLRIVLDSREGFDVDLGTFVKQKTVRDPLRAFWSILWDSVLTRPHRRGWRR